MTEEGKREESELRGPLGGETEGSLALETPQAPPRLSGLALASVILAGANVLLQLALHAGFLLSPRGLGGPYDVMWIEVLAAPLSLVLSPLAAVVGIIAFLQIRERPQVLRGRDLAIAGGVLGILTSTAGMGSFLLLLGAAVLLPVAAVGGVVYWLAKRRRRPPAESEQVVVAGEPVPCATRARARVSALAVASFVLGLLAFPTMGIAGALGVLVGIVALIQMSTSRGRLRGWGLALAGMVLSAGFCALAFVPMITTELAAARRGTCLSNLRTLAMNLQMYATDYDAFPSASRWADEVRDTTGVAGRFFVCPVAPDLACGYGYNAALGSLRPASVSDSSGLVSLFESDRGWNAAGGRELLPKEPRHFGGDNYGFADGHAKWDSRKTVLSGSDPYMQWEPRASSEGPR